MTMAVPLVQALNKQSIEEYVQPKLEAWARWALNSSGGQDNSIIARLTGALVRTAPRAHVLLAHNEDEMIEIQERINRLPPVLKELIETEWLTVGTCVHKAEWHQITRQTYTSRLTLAYYHLITWGL